MPTEQTEAPKKKPTYTPEQTLVRVTGCSATEAALRCKRIPGVENLPKLYAANDRDGIVKLLAGEKPVEASKPE